MKNKLKDKNLLVLSWFPDEHNKSNAGIFVKEQIELVRDYFNEVVVIDAIPYVPPFLLPILPKNQQLLQSKKGYKDANVRVYFPRFLDLRKIPLIGKSVSEMLRLKATEKVIQKEGIKFDIIHANFAYPSGYTGALLKEKLGRPLMVTVHGSSFREFATGRSKVKKQIQKVVVQADFITTPHPELLGYLRGIQAGDKSFFIEKMPSFRESSATAKLKDAKSKKVITFLAMLEDSKDPLTFVRSIPLVLEKRKDVLFVVMGDGRLMPEIKKEVIELGITKNVQILGLRSDRQEILNASDIFCALSPLENIWSGTVQEAMFCRVPMIVTRAGKTEEHLEHKKTAYLIAPRSPSELASAILELLGDGKLREELGKNARLLFDRNWDREKITNQWLEIYERALCTD